MRNSRQLWLFAQNLQKLIIIHVEWTIKQAFQRRTRRDKHLEYEAKLHMIGVGARGTHQKHSNIRLTR